jgi:hypothetical protein
LARPGPANMPAYAGHPVTVVDQACWRDLLRNRHPEIW